MSCCNCLRLIFGKTKTPTAKEEFRDTLSDAGSIDDEFNWAKFDSYVGHCKLRFGLENPTYLNSKLTINDDEKPERKVAK